MTRALHDRQTVVLSLPLDVQDAKTGGSNAPLELSPMPGRLQPNPEDIRRLAEAVGRESDHLFSRDVVPFCLKPKNP